MGLLNLAKKVPAAAGVEGGGGPKTQGNWSKPTESVPALNLKTFVCSISIAFPSSVSCSFLFAIMLFSECKDVYKCKHRAVSEK